MTNLLRMFEWFKSLFKKQEAASSAVQPSSRVVPPRATVDMVRTQMPLDELVRMLQAPKDLVFMVFAAGGATARCKACVEDILPAEKDGLLWMVCPRCAGATFVPMDNLRRDLHLATRDPRGVFQYELSYVHDLPPGLSPP